VRTGFLQYKGAAEYFMQAAKDQATIASCMFLAINSLCSLGCFIALRETDDTVF
jgi:hypothetical protein